MEARCKQSGTTSAGCSNGVSVTVMGWSHKYVEARCKQSGTTSAATLTGSRASWSV